MENFLVFYKVIIKWERKNSERIVSVQTWTTDSLFLTNIDKALDAQVEWVKLILNIVRMSDLNPKN